MKSELVTDAAEYNAATDRINSALQLLRDEMRSLRHKDVSLMQQFLTMNTTIRNISSNQRLQKRRHRKSAAGATSTTTSCPKLNLNKQEKLPTYCNTISETRERTWSVSSEESLLDYSSDSTMSMSDDASDSDDNMASEVPVFRSSVLKQDVSLKSQRSDNNDNTVCQKHSEKVWQRVQDFDTVSNGEREV